PADLSLFVTPPALGAGGVLLAVVALGAAAVACDRALAARAPKARPLAWMAFAIIGSQAAAYAIVVVRFGPISDRCAYGFVLAAALLVAALAQALPDVPPRIATFLPP